MKVFWVVGAALLALVSTLSPVEAQCGARVRKDWDSMTAAEKDTYKGALAAAMDSGAYIKFVEMHTEMQSEMEAHRQCMFIYWHRLLLVVFENMLRGQGSQFACVTVPYYNWVGANNRQLDGTCSSLGDCSNIMTELGGYTNGVQRTVQINGINNSGRCNTISPLNHFCQSGTVSGAACARCVPRSNWGSAAVPSTTAYASVRSQVFSGKNIGEMSPNIEGGCHNNVHASLDSTMGTFAAPADPIFWSHHAMVDALHTVFHKCRVGTQRMTFAEKAAHPVAWTSCAKRNGGNFSPTEVIVMRTGVNGNNPIQGSQDPLIGRYFSGVPNQFAGLMDVRDLGDSSYTYELSGQLADMYNNCDGTPAPPSATPTTAPNPTTPTPPPSTSAPVPTTSPTPATPAPTPAPVPTTRAPVPAPTPPTRRPIFGLFDWFRSRWGSGRRLKAEHGWFSPWYNQAANIRGSSYDHNSAVNSYDQNTVANTYVNNVHVSYNTPATNPASVSANVNVTKRIQVTTNVATTNTVSAQYDGNKNNNVDVIVVNKTCASEKKVTDWYKKTTEAMGGNCPKVIADLERQSCMFADQCLGGIKDYSAQFKATWGVKEPRCLTIVKAIKSGQQKITYINWRQNMEAHFGCPKPANATQSDNQDDSYGNAKQSAELSIMDTIQSAVQSV
ncbi:unnamed protein product [Phytophthora fragariaefolia]|uniref:Unnamed protein product n=1 Tax=Phytophthora fragariaefolia TaxID=1490495 RepID=A0A9W6X9Y5_9STRA|nr:unnamed protein product [Phytophthora fragariaefolia]